LAPAWPATDQSAEAPVSSVDPVFGVSAAPRGVIPALDADALSRMMLRSRAVTRTMGNRMSPPEATWQDHAGPLLAERHGGRVIACRRCGYRHAVPLPAAEDVRRFYAEEFYGGFHKDYFAGQQRDLEWWRLEFRAKCDLLAELLPESRRRFLDVGAGAGWLVEYAGQNGWQAVGLEPSAAAVRYCRDRGLEMIEGFCEPEALADQPPFDVVHLNNVLEHVPDPGALLDTAHGALLDDGLVAVTVPNDFSPLQEALVALRGHEPWWVDPREHVNYFDAPDLERLLVRHGFAPRRRLGSFPLELFALMGDDYLADPALGPVIHGKRKAMELALHAAGRDDLLATMYAKLAEAGMGRTITVVGART